MNKIKDQREKVKKVLKKIKIVPISILELERESKHEKLHWNQKRNNGRFDSLDSGGERGSPKFAHVEGWSKHTRSAYY